MQKHIAVSSPKSAVNVKTVVTPRGLTLWLVESYAVPLVSLEFAMRGGSAQDPPGKAGLGMLLAGLLDEGAGDLDAQAFQRALDEKAIEISFHSDRDAMSGRMRTLTKNLDRAAELLRLAINAPRFDEEPFLRVRENANARLRHDAERPGFGRGADVAAPRPFPAILTASRPTATLESLALIERADLVAAAKRRSRAMRWSSPSSGRSTRRRAAELVDKAFADLPAKADLAPVAEAPFAGLGKIDAIPLDVPQSTIRFGRPGLMRDDPDYIASVVAAHVLGGSGNMTSRLFREVREKRGLAYTVFGNFYAYDYGAFYYGGTTTKNERARESFDVAGARDPRRRAEGPQRRGAREGQDLPHRLLSAALRHLGQDRRTAGPHPARRPLARMARRAQPSRSPR